MASKEMNLSKGNTLKDKVNKFSEKVEDKFQNTSDSLRSNSFDSSNSSKDMSSDTTSDLDMGTRYSSKKSSDTSLSSSGMNDDTLDSSLSSQIYPRSNSNMNSAQNLNLTNQSSSSTLGTDSLNSLPQSGMNYTNEYENSPLGQTSERSINEIDRSARTLQSPRQANSLTSDMETTQLNSGMPSSMQASGVVQSIKSFFNKSEGAGLSTFDKVASAVGGIALLRNVMPSSKVATGPNTNVGQLERVASVAGGVALASYAMRKHTLKSVPGAVFGALGASLIYRGATGHCNMYGAMGVNTVSSLPPTQESKSSNLVSNVGDKAVHLGDRAKSLLDKTTESAGRLMDNAKEKSGRLVDSAKETSSRLVDAARDKMGMASDAMAVNIHKSVVVNKPAEEIYRFWRNLENLPRILSHIENVTVIDDKRSHWTAKVPAGVKLEWDAEITEERENELIAWRSLESADISNRGTVQFKKVGDGATEIIAEMRYDGFTGVIGASLGKVFGQDPARIMEEDLEKFKRTMESGEGSMLLKPFNRDTAELH